MTCYVYIKDGQSDALESLGLTFNVVTDFNPETAPGQSLMATAQRQNGKTRYAILFDKTAYDPNNPDALLGQLLDQNDIESMRQKRADSSEPVDQKIAAELADIQEILAR